MGFHLPSFLVGSSIAGVGFLLIHRELSHRHRLTTKWALQEYAEKEWKQWREGNLDSISDVAKVRCVVEQTNSCIIHLYLLYQSFEFISNNNAINRHANTGPEKYNTN